MQYHVPKKKTRRRPNIALTLSARGATLGERRQILSKADPRTERVNYL